MATKEVPHLGPVYLAQWKLPARRAPFAKVGVEQEHEPWRKGKAWFIPTFAFKRAILLGWWKPQPAEDLDPEYEDVQWIRPKNLFVPPSEIGDWDNGSDVSEE